LSEELRRRLASDFRKGTAHVVVEMKVFHDDKGMSPSEKYNRGNSYMVCLCPYESPPATTTCQKEETPQSPLTPTRVPHDIRAHDGPRAGEGTPSRSRQQASRLDDNGGSRVSHISTPSTSTHPPPLTTPLATRDYPQPPPLPPSPPPPHTPLAPPYSAGAGNPVLPHHTADLAPPKSS
jgi:hypothetical protein